VADKGGIDAVVTAMRTHRDAVAVQDPGCKALCNISFLEYNKARMCAVDSFTTLVPVSYDYWSFSLEAWAFLVGVVQLAVAEKGGIEAVVAAMGAHRDAVQVQQFGCMTLAHIAILAANKARSHMFLCASVDKTSAAVNVDSDVIDDDCFRLISVNVIIQGAQNVSDQKNFDDGQVDLH
jgi:hypothetical protein